MEFPVVRGNKSTICLGRGYVSTKARPTGHMVSESPGDMHVHLYNLTCLALGHGLCLQTWPGFVSACRYARLSVRHSRPCLLISRRKRWQRGSFQMDRVRWATAAKVIKKASCRLSFCFTCFLPLLKVYKGCLNPREKAAHVEKISRKNFWFKLIQFHYRALLFPDPIVSLWSAQDFWRHVTVIKFIQNN